MEAACSRRGLSTVQDMMQRPATWGRSSHRRRRRRRAAWPCCSAARRLSSAPQASRTSTTHKSTLRNSLLLFRVLIVVSSLVSVLGYAGGQGSEVQFNDAVDCYEKAFACLLPTIDPTVTAVLPLRIGGTSSPFAAAARPLPLLRQLPPLLWR
jgi:hypothetical protein